MGRCLFSGLASSTGKFLFDLLEQLAVDFVGQHQETGREEKDNGTMFDTS